MSDAAEDVDLEFELEDSSAPGSERRTSARYVARLGVRFADEAEFARAYSAYTHNIGLGGLCLSTDKPYRRGDAVSLEVELPRGRTLSVKGLVAWVKPGVAAGIHFTELKAEQEQLLRELLAAGRRA